MPDTVFRLDPEIIIGLNTVNRAGALCGSRGHKILVATEQGLHKNNVIERLTRILEDSSLEIILFDEIPAQATAETAEEVASLARGARCDMILGFGGLNTQYIARLTSILAASSLKLYDLLEGKTEEKAFLPYAAVPTTGGDPLRFTDYLIAVDPRDRIVKMIKCPPSQCQAAILDPSLSEHSGGKLNPTAIFDGLCVSIEAYCSTKAGLFSDALLEQAISLFAKMMHSCAENQNVDYSAASINAELLMSIGASISSPGIGTALAYALSGKFPVTKSCGAMILLPHIMGKLLAARPEKMAKIAALMGESVKGLPKAEAANMGIDVVKRRMGQLELPAKLKDINLSLDRLVPVSDTAQKLEFVAFSPWTVGSEDAYDLLKQAY